MRAESCRRALSEVAWPSASGRCACRDWSADGSNIVFTSDGLEPYTEIYVADIDASNLRELISLHGGPGQPNWSLMTFSGEYRIARTDSNPDVDADPCDLFAVTDAVDVLAVSDALQVRVVEPDRCGVDHRGPTRKWIGHCPVSSVFSIANGVDCVHGLLQSRCIPTNHISVKK